MSTTYITVRIPKEVKDDLEKLTKIVGINLSDLIRDVIVKIARVKEKIEVHDTVERLEESVIRAIILLPEFQELLKMLWKFVKTERIAVGFSGERIEEFTTLYRDYTIVYKDNMWYPVKIVEVKDCNEYGTCWTDHLSEEKIKSFRELVEFLEEAEYAVDSELKTKINEVKEYIGKLLRL